MGNSACCQQNEEGTGTVVAQVSSSAVPPPEEPELKGFGREPEEQPVSKADEPKEEPWRPQPPPKAEEVPEPPKVQDRPALNLTFNDGGRETVFAFTTRPLGMDFHRSLPITVKKVHPGSLAERMGVTNGMVLTKVDGEDISSKRLEEMHSLLKRVAGDLPPASSLP